MLVVEMEEENNENENNIGRQIDVEDAQNVGSLPIDLVSLSNLQMHSECQFDEEKKRFGK